MTMARHPKARIFVRQRLFAGLKSFAELEQRLSVLPDEQARGAAFEVFAEAYLAMQRKHDAAQVWPLPSASLDLLQILGLSTNDYGVDGVLQATLGHLNVYQVKFRTNRQPLTWRELSTFIGQTDSLQIHNRVLFTNCDDLPSVMNERRGFFCIRGSDLDRLQKSDFTAIENWLAGVIAPYVTGLIVSKTGNFYLAFSSASVILLVGAVCYLFVVGEVAPVVWPAAAQPKRDSVGEGTNS